MGSFLPFYRNLLSFSAMGKVSPGVSRWPAVWTVLMLTGQLAGCGQSADQGAGDSGTDSKGGDNGQSNGAPSAGGTSGTGGASTGGSENTGGSTEAGGSHTGGSVNSGGSGGSEATHQVLMIVANSGFFFQEYYDPRIALEDAGFTISVASGLGGEATPHANSYDGRYTGTSAEVIDTISGTLAVSAVDSADYDALVLVGGWGAGRYYYAYPGTFLDSSWQPNSAQANAVNGLIGEFVADDKYILAVCNGVNVLAWSRVTVGDEEVSPLDGRNVRAPWGSAPAQTDYLGESYSTSWTIDQACPWEPTADCFRMGRFASDNGAIIPNPYDSTPGEADPEDTNRRDAVAQDGQFITVQDNFAARTGGELLAELLTDE